jgi:hypothetical protein
VNDLVATTKVVPATTLDTLSRQLAPQAPFLLKLDVQGGETDALLGATEVLKGTHVVICETDVDDFEAVNAVLAARGFVLYDLTGVNRLADGTLGWFYPVYVSCALDLVRPKEFWDASVNDAVIRVQDERRKAILKSNAEILERVEKGRVLRRNNACPCGSGRKYKHCCGAAK